MIYDDVCSLLIGRGERERRRKEEEDTPAFSIFVAVIFESNIYVLILILLDFLNKYYDGCGEKFSLKCYGKNMK